MFINMGHFTFPMLYCLVLLAMINAQSSALEPTETVSQLNANESQNIHQSTGIGYKLFNMTKQEILQVLQGQDAPHPLHFLDSLCPGANSCAYGSRQTDLIQEKRNDGSCCIQCDCSDDCFISDNCCPDKDMINVNATSRTITRAGERCFSAVTPNTPVSNYEWNMDRHLQYLMRGDCSNSLDVTSTLKCELPNKFVMEEVAPVYSTKTGFFYRNKFCAECNDDSENMVYWRPYLKCNRYTSSRRAVRKNAAGESLRNFYKTKPPECYLVWKPPVENYKICVSLIPEHLKYPIRSEKYTFLNHYCEHYDILYKTRQNIYRNVFCFLIVELVMYKKNSYLFSNNGCPAPSYCDLNKLEDCGYTFEDFPFMIMLNFNDQLDSTSSQTDALAPKPCKGKFYYSSTLEKCLRQDCSTSYTYINGTCRSLLGEISTAVYDFRLRFSFSENVSSIDVPERITEINRIGQQLERTAQQLVLEAKPTGKICQTKLNSVEHSNGQRIYYVAVILNIESPHIVETVYTDFKDKLFAFQSNSNTVFQVSMGGNVKFPILFTDHIRYLIYEDTSEYDCYYAIAVADIQFCETVILPSEHFVTSGPSIRMYTNNATFHPDEYLLHAEYFESNNSVHITHAQICKSTYISRMGEILEVRASSVGIDLSNCWDSYDRTILILAYEFLLYACFL